MMSPLQQSIITDYWLQISGMANRLWKHWILCNLFSCVLYFCPNSAYNGAIYCCSNKSSSNISCQSDNCGDLWPLGSNSHHNVHVPSWTIAILSRVDRNSLTMWRLADSHKHRHHSSPVLGPDRRKNVLGLAHSSLLMCRPSSEWAGIVVVVLNLNFHHTDKFNKAWFQDDNCLIFIRIQSQLLSCI